MSAWPAGTILEGVVSRIMQYGTLITLPEGGTGMVHISEVSSKYVTDINEFLKVGDSVKVLVLGVDEKGRVSLSIKRLEQPSAPKDGAVAKSPARPATFEDMMSKFMKDSEEKLSEYKRSTGRKSGGYARGR